MKRSTGDDLAPQYGSHRSGYSRVVWIFLALFVITTLAFAYRVSITGPWFGSLAPDRRSHDWLTAHTLIHATYWYEEGAWALHFGTFWHPNTIESPSLASRGLYCSFPPGYVLPIYLISRLAGHAPTVALIMSYNLANHFLLALIVAFTVAFSLISLKIPPVSTICLGAIPILLTLLLPGPMYFMQAAYFSHTAVLVPFALLALLEFWRDVSNSNRTRRWLFAAQGVISFVGVLTDWLCIIVVITLFAKRLVLRELGSDWRSFAANTIGLFSGPLLAMILFGFQLWSLDALTSIWNRFIYRTGGLNFSTVHLDSTNPTIQETVSFFDKFWYHKIPRSFNFFGLYLIWLSMAAWILMVAVAYIRSYRGKPLPLETKAVLSLMGIYLLPCLGETYVLRQHCIQHDFMALKFIIPLSTIPMALLVATLRVMLGREGDEKESIEGASLSSVRRSEWRFGLVALLALASSTLYVTLEQGRCPGMFFPVSRENEAVGRFVRNNTSYNDVVFSEDYSSSTELPQTFCHAMRPVHHATSWKEICDKVSRLPKEAAVDILTINPSKLLSNLANSDVIESFGEVKVNGKMRLYRIPWEVLSKECAREADTIQSGVLFGAKQK